MPRWLGNLGACFPTAVLRGAAQTGTAYAGFYVAHQAQTMVTSMGEEAVDAMLVLTHSLVLVGGGLIGWQVAGLMESGARARAEQIGEPVPACLGALRGAVLFAATVGPLATAFVMNEATHDRQRQLDVVNTVAALYIYSAVRDFINELLPRHLLLELADYDGGERLDPASALRLRGTNIMTASLLPNSVAAMAGKLMLQRLLGDVVLAEAVTRGLYAFINEMSRGVAASNESADATVRPVPVACRPRPSLKGWVEEGAMRSALALPAQGLYGLANLIDDSTLINMLAHMLVFATGCTASAVSEFRGLLVQFGRLGHLPEAAARHDEDDVVIIHATLVDLQRPVSFHMAPAERPREPYIYL
ncbi:MAG: hypothetical protein H7332_08505 [Bdellovibrionales bacterium]|nr:hypothetical protein [Ramlibacter sp.]